MLTRIEIDGFKTFRDFALDVPPFLVVLGKNASGKSNLFDAVQFLRRLAGGSVVDALQGMRGETEELFHRRQDGSTVDTISFACEVLLDPRVRDPYGEEVEVRHTRVRYEVSLKLRHEAKDAGRVHVVRETATLIRQADDRWAAEQQVSRPFRRAHLRYSSRSTPELLGTGADDAGRSAFFIHQEGHAGRRRQLPAHAAEATVLSSVTTTEFPLLYALRRELQSWRFLQLEPGALRLPSSFRDVDRLDPSGGNLASVLNRIAESTGTPDRPTGDLADISADLARLIPGVVSLDVLTDEARRQWEVQIRTRDEAPFNARVASDGTLRLLALLAVLYDPDYRGLICFEEPENGIFPRRLSDFVKYLRTLVSDPRTEWSGDEPLAQLVLSSHSPVVLDAVEASSVVYADTTTLVQGGAATSRVTRMRRLVPTRQAAFDGLDEPLVTHLEVEAYKAHELLAR